MPVKAPVLTPEQELQIDLRLNEAGYRLYQAERRLVRQARGHERQLAVARLERYKPAYSAYKRAYRQWLALQHGTQPAAAPAPPAPRRRRVAQPQLAA